MKLLRVKRSGDPHWHWAIESELRFLCGCLCRTPGVPRKQGDALCRCPCHKFGMTGSLSLCEKADRKYGRERGSAVQLPMFEAAKVEVKRKPWCVVVGRDKGCQRCQALAVKITRGELEWAVNEAGK